MLEKQVRTGENVNNEQLIALLEGFGITGVDEAALITFFKDVFIGKDCTVYRKEPDASRYRRLSAKIVSTSLLSGCARMAIEPSEFKDMAIQYLEWFPAERAWFAVIDDGTEDGGEIPVSVTVTLGQPPRKLRVAVPK